MAMKLNTPFQPQPQPPSHRLVQGVQQESQSRALLSSFPPLVDRGLCRKNPPNLTRDTQCVYFGKKVGLERLRHASAGISPGDRLLWCLCVSFRLVSSAFARVALCRVHKTTDCIRLRKDMRFRGCSAHTLAEIFTSH